MGLVWQLLKHLVWFTLRGVFYFGRRLVWEVTGVRKKLKVTDESPSFENSVHVRKILLKYDFGNDPDGLEFPAGEQNMLTFHDRFEHMDYLLKPHVTLSFVTLNEAFFVESEESVNALHSDNGALVRCGQLRKAKYLLRVPIATFHNFAEQVGDPPAEVVLLLNTARCGSNAFVQVFEAMEKCCVWSEPDALNTLSLMLGECTNDVFNSLAKSIVRVLCKPDGRRILRYFIKPNALAGVVIPTLHKLFPNSKVLFLYRDGLDQAKSLNRIFDVFPSIKAGMMIGRYAGAMFPLVMKVLGYKMPEETAKRISKSAFAMYAGIWADAFKVYLDYRSQGLPVHAVKYEHFRDNPQDSFRKIFAHLELDFDAFAVESALGKDALRATPISSENVRYRGFEELTEENMRHMDEICDQFCLPRFPQPYEAPGTIS